MKPYPTDGRTLVVQLHPDMPLYQAVDQAAKTLGIGRDTLNMYMDRAQDPMPYIRPGGVRGFDGRVRRVCIPRAIQWLEERG